MQQLYLREQDKQRLMELLREYLPGVKAWAYGSRVNGTAHEASDLDLALRSSGLESISASSVFRFQEALSQSNIPILVDVHDWLRLPKSFQAEIAKRHVELA